MVVRGWLLLQLAGAGLQVPQRAAPVIGLIGPPIACQQPSTMQACSNGRRWVAPPGCRIEISDEPDKYLTPQPSSLSNLRRIWKKKILVWAPSKEGT